MSLNEMDVNIGKNDLQAKGSLSNYLPYFLKNETLKGNLSLNSSYLNLNDFISDTEETSTETEVTTDTTTMFLKIWICRLKQTLKKSFSKKSKSIISTEIYLFQMGSFE